MGKPKESPMFHTNGLCHAADRDESGVGGHLGARDLLLYYASRRSLSQWAAMAGYLLCRPPLMLRATRKVLRGVCRASAAMFGQRPKIQENPCDFSALCEIETERLSLRPLVLADLDNLVDHFPASHLGPRFSRNHQPPAWWNELGFISDLTNNRFSWLVERTFDKTCVGCCALGTYTIDGRREIELGYWTGESFWGNGYAPEAAQAVLESVRDLVGASRIVSLIAPTNYNSIRVAEKIGMRFERESQFRGGATHVYVSD